MGSLIINQNIINGTKLIIQMFKRRSTLDPIQKQKKSKQTQYYSILQTCIQIPNDDKLIVRKLILNEEDHLIDMFQKYKKYKNLRQLQILLRKYIQNYKNNQNTNLVNLYKSTSKHNLFLNQQKSFKKITTMSSLHGSLVQSPKKQKGNQNMIRNNTKKTLVDLDSLQWEKRIQNQIQKEIQTNMNQKQEEFQIENGNESYEIPFIQDDSSFVQIQQVQKKIEINQQKLSEKNCETIQKQVIRNIFKKKQAKNKQKKSKQKQKQKEEITQININISWQRQNDTPFKIDNKKTQKTRQTQTNDQQLQLTLKQIKFDTNIINADNQSQKSYPTTNPYSPQIRISDCYASQIKQFAQNTNSFHKSQSTVRSSFRSSMKYQPNMNIYPTKRSTLANKQNIKKELFYQIDQKMPKFNQKYANQSNFQYMNKFNRNLLQYSKQSSLQGLSQQKCKITNSAVSYRPQIRMEIQNLDQLVCLTSKKNTNSNSKLLYHEKVNNRRVQQQQRLFNLSNRTKLFDCAENKTKYFQNNLNQNRFHAQNYPNICKSQVFESQISHISKSDINKNNKSKQMDFYKRIQMTINGQMD